MYLILFIFVKIFFKKIISFKFFLYININFIYLISKVNGLNLAANSTGTTQVSEQEQQQPEYKAELEQLKSYYGFCKRFIMRLRVEEPRNLYLQKSVERVIEIIEGRRYQFFELYIIYFLELLN